MATSLPPTSTDSDNPKSLSDNLVFAIYEDRAGALWIGTNLGLDRLDRSTGNFIHYSGGLNGSDKLSGLPVSSISQILSALWLGTYGSGLYTLDLATN